MRHVWWILVAGLVVGCDMEDPAGSLSVETNSGVARPDWLSIQDVDHNRDKIINVKDLVLVASFFGQEVPEAVTQTEPAADDDDTAEVDESDSLPLVCQDIKAGVIYPNTSETVTDNTELRKLFDAPNGGSYVYSLLALVRTRPYLSTRHAPAEAFYPWCTAVRFRIDENMWPTEVKLKPVAWFHRHKDMSSDVLTVSLPHYHEANGYAETKMRFYLDTKRSEVRAEPYIIVNSGVNNPARTIGGYWELVVRSKARMCIPITDGRVICGLGIATQEGGHKMGSLFDIAQAPGIKGGFKHARAFDQNNHIRNNHGMYINMSPTEVRQRYFPEDIN